MSGSAECGPVVLWVAGLCAVVGGCALLAAFPRNSEGFHVGLAGGIAVGMFAALAWYVAAMCRAC